MLLLAACSGSDSDTATRFQEVDAAIDGNSSVGDSGTAAPGVDDAAPEDSVDRARGDDDVTNDDMADSDMTDDSDAEFGFFDSEAERDQLENGAAQEDPTTEPGERLPAEVTALFVGRQIIKTGDIVVEAANVRETTDAIIDTVFDNGGAIWGQETQSEPTPRAVLTIRVPPADFDRLIAAVTRVPGVGVVSESTTSDDVTEVVVDLDARITAATSSVARVQQLLDDARDLNTIFQLEEELGARQADLERLLGQRKTIGDQIALSTITLTVLELDPDRLRPEMEVVAWLGANDDEACPGSSNLTMGSDDTAVLCVSVNNTGEDTLTEVSVDVPAFRLRVDDFTIVQGVATLEELKAGDELLFTVELDADDGFINRVDASDGINLDVEASATPATSDGVELTGTDGVFISAEGDDPLPGFGESFANGWGAMLAVVGVFMIVLGVLLPFIPIIILVVWVGRKIVTKQRERAEERAAFVDAYVAAQAQNEPQAE